MLVKIEARILIFPGTDFHFPSTSVPPGTFLGSADGRTDRRATTARLLRPAAHIEACAKHSLKNASGGTDVLGK